MVPTTREIAMQIAVAHELYPKESISDLASRLMLSPIFIINALNEGERMELFTRIKTKKGELTDNIEATISIDYSSLTGVEFGSEHIRIQNEILKVIASANEDQMDTESITLEAWCRGIRPFDIELSLHVLNKLGLIDSYKLSDPNDKKSEYTFYSLRFNVLNRWGVKQFKAKK